MVPSISRSVLFNEAKRVAVRDELLADGVSSSTISYRLSAGIWRRFHSGVYVTDDGPLSLELRMFAASRVSPAAALSHATAARLLRLDGSDELSGPIHLTAERTVDVGENAGLRLHRTRRLAPEDLTRVYGLRCTSLSRTIVDVFETVDDRKIKVMMFEDCWRRNPLARLELLDCLDRLRKGLHNVRELEQLIRRHPQNARPTESAAEAIADDLIWQLAPTERQVDFYDAQGHIGRVDLIVRDLRIAIEVDSRKYHRYETTFDSDPLRDQRLRALGWEVHRITWKHLMDPSALFRRLYEAFSHRRALLGTGRVVPGPMPTVQQAFGF